jgi:hypothetical protein
MKDAGIRIRVEKNLREAFVSVCQAADRRASDVLREFMQTYVERHQQGQGDLFTVGRESRPRNQQKPSRLNGRGTQR